MAAWESRIWDVTIPDTLANSHLPRAFAVSGVAAEDASLRKISKYTGVRQRYDFVAIAAESLGPINKDGSILFREIGKCLTTISGDPLETSFLLQCISVTLQRYIAVAFRGSFQEGSGLIDWSLRKILVLDSILWISRDHLYLRWKNEIYIVIIIIFIIIIITILLISLSTLSI